MFLRLAPLRVPPQEAELRCSEVQRDTIYVDADTKAIIMCVLSKDWLEEHGGCEFDLDALAGELPSGQSAGCGAKLGAVDVSAVSSARLSLSRSLADSSLSLSL
eukprot:SAG31_NODE_1199_length_9431_cov_18.273789_11_plen_104_part_00